jgi:phage terminase large subunit-like protein
VSGNPPTREEYERRWGEIEARSLAEIGPSLADRFRALPKEDRERILDSLTAVEFQRLLHDWRFWARPKQLAPQWEWDVWFLLGGRGSGKSRPAAEYVDEQVRTGAWRTFAIIGPDYQHVVKWMIGGEQGKERNGSGLKDIGRPWCMPELIVSALELRYPNGAVGHITTAEQPEYRGPNLDGAWGDEPSKWRYGATFIQNLELATRGQRLDGGRPQIVYTANPANLLFLLQLIMDEGTHVTWMTMRENMTNLPASFVRKQERKLLGTEDGDRELLGIPRFFGDDSKKTFPLSVIDAFRVDTAPALGRIIVIGDPGASTNDGSDPTGIVAEGVDARGHVYVLEDRTEPSPPKRKPEDWGDEIVQLAIDVGASEIWVETNKGGDMALAVVRAAIARRRAAGKRVPPLELKGIYTKGDKASRASPVRTLYVSGEVHHVGRLAELETEQSTWQPGQKSPNRLDATVIGVHILRPDIMQDGPDPGATELQDAAKATAEIQREQRTMDPSAVGWDSTGGSDWTL